MTASLTFRALGTSATVAVAEPSALGAACALLATRLADLDAACSRFRSDSDLSRVNARAGEPVAIGPLLVEAVQVAIRAAETTGGLVTPALGTELARAGYDRTFELVRTRGTWAVRPVMPRRDAWRELELDADRGVLRIPRGVELDLGATAKALAADTAAAALAEETGTGVLVSLGGDIAVAGDPPPDGWIVRIADDHEAPLDAPGPSVDLAAGGLATSSIAVRRWHTESGEAHHVIDPRTASPAATVWRTVTVAGASCVDANVAALCALLLGNDAPAWLERRGLHARLVRRNGTLRYAGRWPVEAEVV